MSQMSSCRWAARLRAPSRQPPNAAQCEITHADCYGFMAATVSQLTRICITCLPAHDARLRAVKKLAKPLAIGLSVLLLGIILWAADLARFAGVFQETSIRFPGECSAVALGGSSADLQVDRERGVAYLSFLDGTAPGRKAAR